MSDARDARAGRGGVDRNDEAKAIGVGRKLAEVRMTPELILVMLRQMPAYKATEFMMHVLSCIRGGMRQNGQDLQVIPWKEGQG